MLVRMRRRVVRIVPSRLLNALTHLVWGDHPALRRLARERARIVAAPPAGHLADPLGPLYPRLVDTFDAGVERADVAGAVADCLTAAGLAYVRLPQVADHRAGFALAVEDRAATLAALGADLAGAEWGLSPFGPRRSERRLVGAARRPSRPGRRLLGASEWLVFRALAVRGPSGGSGGRLVSAAGSGCVVQFWRRIERPDLPRRDGGTYEPGTRMATPSAPVAYLTPRTWDAAVAAPDHVAVGAGESLFDVRFPVDLVYTWVDGSDPQWLDRRAAYLDPVSAAHNAAHNVTAAHDSRYQSRDELRYSLRSVAMFASWARRIFIVTDQQVPAWLDTTDPRIQVVDHREIFADPSVLPVFNSHAIESQLHHIPDLAEHYLYLNDDMLFGRPVRPELFFLGNGLGRFFLSPLTLDLDPPSPRDLPVMSAAKVNRAVLEQRFGATVSHKFLHAPYPQQRSVLEQMEREQPELFARVAASRFRHPDDASIPSALSHYYAYGLGRAVPGQLSYLYQDIAADTTPARLRYLLHARTIDTFCLNDHQTPPEREAAIAAEVGAFFEQYFPAAGPFERPDAATMHQ